MLADKGRYLADADVLTPQMLDVVIAAAQSPTFAHLALLREDDLPSPYGAVILPRPLVTSTSPAAKMALRPPGVRQGGARPDVGPAAWPLRVETAG
jgi:hypothetical protein